MKDRVVKALAKADAIAQKYISGDIEIPKEDLLILKKYESLGVCKMTLKRKSLQEELYWPILEAPELAKFSYSFYLQLVHAVCRRYSIKTSFSMNSVREYCNKPYNYGFIEPKLLPDSYVGKQGVSEELALLKIALNEDDEEEADERREYEIIE